MKCAHISDVHIRSFTRHKEYAKIFEELYQTLKQECVEHIFLVGDIAHTKTDESPEFYDFTANFLKALSKIAPVHILLGNHDGNLLNANRLDVITPIVRSLDIDNIKLYKKSQRIDIENFSFFAYSLFDKGNWNTWAIDNERINVALFHGTVSGARTDLNYYLDGDIDVSEFNRYDFGFLGDIHCAQSLAEKDCYLTIDEEELDNYPDAEIIEYIDTHKVRIKIKQSHIKYSGSLVQQDFGEDIKKGFLIWDIKSKNEWTSKFATLQPVHPFLTIKIDDINNVNVEDYAFIPDESCIRLKFKNDFDSRAIDKLALIFKNRFKAKLITTVVDIDDSKGLLLVDSKLIKIEDLRNIDIQEKLIRNYFSNSKVKNILIDKIIELNNTYDVDNKDALIRNINWKIKSLTFSNIFAFKENNMINFEKLKGIVGIFGKNTIGKSSIIDSILYGIFNSNSKDIVKNQHIINTRKNSCCVKLNLEVNNVPYVIDRVTKRIIAGKRVQVLNEHSRTDLDFYKLENGEATSLNGLQRSDTEKNIRNIFGTVDDFLTSCVAAQFDINHFIDHGSTRRKEIIGKFLDLGILDEKYRRAKEDAVIYKNKLKMYSNKNYVKLLEITRAEEKDLKSDLSKEKKLKIKLDKDLTMLTDKLSKLLSKYDEYTTLGNYDDICKQINEYKKYDNVLYTDIVQLREIASNCASEYNVLVNDDLQAKLLTAKAAVDSLRMTATTLEKLKSSRNEKLIEQKQLQKSVMLLNDIPCGDEYPTCKFIRDSHIAKKELSKYNNIIDKLSNDIETTKSTIDSFINCEEILTESQNKIYEKQQLENRLENIKLQIENKELEMLHNNDKIMQLTLIKNDLESKGIDKLNVTAIKDEITTIENEIIKMKTQIKSCVDMQMSLSKKIGATQNNIINLINEEKSFKDISDKYCAYELYMQAMSRNGIQHDIIKSKLSFINSEIDKLLRNIVKFKIKVVEENDKLDIYIDYGDSGGQRIIETASGMEKTFASLAIRIALIQISTLPKSDLFIIDECFGALDPANLELASRMLQMLKQHFTTVLVITHLESIKDCVDYILTINRDADKYSYVG